MKRTREELFQALTILQDECRSHESCEDCPLRRNSEFCMLTEQVPSFFKIHNPHNEHSYRAFDGI